MTNSPLFWISICSFFLMALGAIAARVLHAFSRHELEVYCRQRNRAELFDEVLDSHERFAMGAEALQFFGLAATVVSSSILLFDVSKIDTVQLQETNFTQVVLATFIFTLLLVLTNTWIPWVVVRFASAPFLYNTWSIWKQVSVLAWPFHVGYSAFNFAAHRIAGQQHNPDEEEEALEEEIRTIVTAGERDGLLEAPAREMIEGVIELDDLDVGDIMTPRSKMNALDIELEPKDIIHQAIEFGHTRIPIYEGEIENIIGILFVKDLLKFLSDDQQMNQINIRDFLRPPQFVPISTRGDELLQKFLTLKSHLSIVVDEYQSVVGVVTIEDALEEIVGDITDETDNDQETEFVTIDKHRTLVLGSVHVDDLNERLKIELPVQEEFDTIAGLVLKRLGRIARIGESINEGNIRIEVLEASKRKIEKLQIEVLDDENEQVPAASKAS